MKDDKNPATSNGTASQDQQVPSKSQRKREATALQGLGARLVELSAAQLATMPLPADLLIEIQKAQNIPQHGAYRRQLQYIGKLMRSIDAEPIAAALAVLEHHNAAGQRVQRHAEELRSALLANDETALTVFLNEHPTVDRQHLRQLMRNAIREQKQDKSPKFRRALLRYLRDILQADAG